MADEKVMPQKDRIELRRIMKARFEILAEQLGQRENEIRTKIKSDLEAEHKAVVKEAERKARALEAKAAKLDRKVVEFRAKVEEEAIALAAEAEAIQSDLADKGVQPINNGHYYREEVPPMLAVNADRWYDGQRFVTVIKQFQPIDLNKKVTAAYNVIAQEAGLHKLDLRMKELELSEELAIGALGSEEAKGFLAKVPTIDNLLPAPSKKALKQVAATVEG